MTQHTTGSSRGPAGRSRAPRRTAVILVVGIGATITFQLLGAVVREARAQDNTVDGIFCGVPLARQLAPNATDSFNTSLQPGTVASADIAATDQNGRNDFVKLESAGFTPATSTCGGELLLTAISGPGMIPVTGTLSVNRSCPGSAAQNYTLTLSVVSQGQDNCAVPLPCGMPLSGSLDLPGEVDSYTFSGSAGDQVSISETFKGDARDGQVRLRLFDPSGTSIFDQPGTCPASLQTQLPKSGAYTVLISPCGSGASTGNYTLTWQPSASCTPKQPPNQFAYVVNADSGTMSVIDLSTNTAKLAIPITASGTAEIASPTYVAITPNGGFAWATYSASNFTSVVNTSTNVLATSVPTGFDSNGVAISPDGSLAYVVSDSLGGIALVDTQTNKVTSVVALADDLGFVQGIQAVAAQDGTFLYVVSEDGSALAKINAQDYVIENVAPYDLGIYDAFAVSADGTFAYVGTLDGIGVIDTDTMMQTGEIANVGGEPFAIAFSPDGRTAYATLPDTPDPNDPSCNDPEHPKDCPGTIAVIDVASEQVTKILVNAAGDSPGGIAISPETGLAYVTDFTAGSDQLGVFVIDTATYKTIASVPALGDSPSAIALTTAPTGLCVGDAKGETKVTVDELVLSVNYLLNGCPGRFPSVPFP
jgi:YVTN family beta-propeller protein